MRIVWIVSLLFFVGCNQTNTVNETVSNITGDISKNNSVVVEKPKQTLTGWYMRTVVRAMMTPNKIYMHNTAGVFGQLDESSDLQDVHDIASYGSAVLQIVFVPEWELNNIMYFSDYHSYPNNTTQEWKFQVLNLKDVNLSNASLEIKIEGIYEIYKNVNSQYEEVASQDTSRLNSLVLLDIDNQKSYNYSELETVSLSMDGKHIRTFKWVISGENTNTLATKGLSKSTNTVGIQKDRQNFIMKSALSSGKFGIPPE